MSIEIAIVPSSHQNIRTTVKCLIFRRGRDQGNKLKSSRVWQTDEHRTQHIAVTLSPPTHCPTDFFNKYFVHVFWTLYNTQLNITEHYTQLNITVVHHKTQTKVYLHLLQTDRFCEETEKDGLGLFLIFLYIFSEQWLNMSGSESYLNLRNWSFKIFSGIWVFLQI